MIDHVTLIEPKCSSSPRERTKIVKGCLLQLIYSWLPTLKFSGPAKTCFKSVL